MEIWELLAVAVFNLIAGVAFFLGIWLAGRKVIKNFVNDLIKLIKKEMPSWIIEIKKGMTEINAISRATGGNV